ncbi:MAG: InlB B-repeat-containing protein [Clostridia bacterium]|nr:InlB B-repeat-containing protein [Clostridia bacterium]
MQKQNVQEKDAQKQKRVLIIVLSVLLCLILIAVIVAVSVTQTKHKHKFDKQVVSEEYLVSDATCTQRAIYYYSCSCGKKNSETFEYGEALGHSFTESNYVYNGDATFEQDGTKTAKCDRCDVTDTKVAEGTALSNVYTVEFVDYNNEIIDSQEVKPYGDAIAPEEPTRIGYKFIGWDTSFTAVLKNLTVKAQYVKIHTVTFVDFNGTVLDKVSVENGSKAQTSASPDRAGYDFIGWSFDLQKEIEADTVITALYRRKAFDVKFVMPDGAVIPYTYIDYSGDKAEEKTVDAQTVEYGFSAFAPTCPDCYVDWENMKAYSFTKWDKSFANITDNTVITAIYDSEYNLPVIAVKFGKNGNGDDIATLTICLPSNLKMYAINLSIDYKPEVGSMSIESATVNSASPLWVEDNGNGGNQLVINNNTKQFTFAWVDANGKSFTYTNVLSFIINLDGGARLSGDTFEVENSTVLIVSSDDKDFQKITPVIIYRVVE